MELQFLCSYLVNYLTMCVPKNVTWYFSNNSDLNDFFYTECGINFIYMILFLFITLEKCYHYYSL